MRKLTKKVNVTFSIPENINSLLHSLVEKRGMSQFVTKALERALEEERLSLKAAYAAANDDSDRRLVLQDWSAFDSDGWDE
jgi:hypothetical protein